MSKKKVTIILVIWTIFVVVAIEGISYLVYPKGHLDNILSVIERDHELFWSSRKDFSANFYGADIRTDESGLRCNNDDCKKIGGKKILILGGSPTFGWGVKNSETYSALLEKKLGGKYQVINGGVIGYSSHQGVRWFRRVLREIRPEIVTVSFVINDVDRYRFFRNNGLSDRETPTQFRRACLVAKTLDKLYSLKLLKKILGKLFSGAGGDSKVRVSGEDYRKNLLEFVKIARNQNIKLVFVKMLVNLPLGPEELSEKERQSPRINEAYECAKRAREYNEVMADVASKNGVMLVDVTRTLSKQSDDFFLVEQGDRIHPNALGHAVIADELARSLKK